MEWNTQVHHDQQQLFMRADNQVWVLKQQDGPLQPPSLKASIQSNNFSVKPFAKATSMPKLSVPARVQFGSCLLTNYHILDTQVPPSTPSTFKQWLKRLPPAEYRLLHYFSELAPNSYKKMARILQNSKGKLQAESDSGMKKHGGAFAWLLLSAKYWPVWRSAGPVDGWECCQSSLCSELMAIASLCLAISEFCLFMKIPEIKCLIPIGIDNLQAIKAIAKLRDSHDSQKFPANADALSIMEACPEVISRLRPYHVKSHQDKHQPCNKLPKVNPNLKKPSSPITRGPF